ncbi:hypothetical protein KIPB_010588, partial [Kipferlia bialata]
SSPFNSGDPDAGPPELLRNPGTSTDGQANSYVYTDLEGTFSNEGYFSGQDDKYIMYLETPGDLDAVQVKYSGDIKNGDSLYLSTGVCTQGPDGIQVTTLKRVQNLDTYGSLDIWWEVSLTGDYSWTRDIYTYTEATGSFENVGRFPNQVDKYVMFPASPDAWDAVQIRCTGKTEGTNDQVELFTGMCTEGPAGTSVSNISNSIASFSASHGTFDYSYELNMQAGTSNCAFAQWEVENNWDSRSTDTGFSCDYSWTVDTYTYRDESGTFSNQGYFNGQVDKYIMYPESQDWDAVQVTCTGDTIKSIDLVQLYTGVCSVGETGRVACAPYCCHLLTSR